jgi:hypothetical protein
MRGRSTAFRTGYLSTRRERGERREIYSIGFMKSHSRSIAQKGYNSAKRLDEIKASEK